jgi:glycosyltransferase involved in cell wall biosynthesis
MDYRVLCIIDRSDLAHTELFIGLKKAGVDIEVICNPTGRYYARLKSAGVPVTDLILKSRFDLSGIHRIAHHLKTKPYDILYCFTNPAVSNTLIASRGRRYKIITYRGTIGNISFASPASWTTYLHPRVDRIVCVSNAVRDYLSRIRLFGLKIPVLKLVTIYKGHDPGWYDGPPADLSGFNIAEGDFVVGFAGRDRPNKGIGVLVDSAQFLPKNLPIHFILIGRLLENRPLRRKIKNSPYAANIHLTGYRQDAPAIAAACDVFVMPSTRKEGLSRAVIEAMSCGTPPIVSNLGGLSEIVVDQECGRLVPPKNPAAIAAAILDLYHHPEKRKKLGEKAKQRIYDRFHIQDTISQTIGLFEELRKEKP